MQPDTTLPNTTLPSSNQKDVVTDPNLLNGATPLKTLNPVDSTSASNALVNSLTTGDASLGTQSIGELKTNVDTAKSKVDTTTSEIDSLMKQLGMQGQDEAQLKQDYNIQGNVKELQDLNLQLTQKQNAYKEKYKNIENKPIPMEFITGQLAATQRQEAFDVGALAAVISAKQGNLELANQQIADAIKAKYDPLKDLYSRKIDFYNMNKDSLTEAQKALGERQNLIWDRKLKDIETQADNEKQVFDMRSQALAQGADKALTDSVIGKTPTEASKILGKYATDYLKYNLLKEQIATEKTQRAKLNADIAQTNKQTELLGSSTSGVSPVTGKPYTDAQIQSAGFADRISQANAIIDSKADAFAEMNYATFKLIESNSQIANALLKPDQRQAAQAMRNFITAKLRKESGAAISKSEFDEARVQYFPALGDDPQTLANKKALRESVLNNLSLGSAGAYTPPNPFQQSLGTNNTPITGTSILSGTSKDGTLNFNIPKN